MARGNGAKTETSAEKLPLVSEAEEFEDDEEELEEEELEVEEAVQDIDSILNSLKSLLSAVEKLQKARQEVGDIKPLIMRMLDGELVSGEELEQLKTGIAGLTRLVRAYSDHQSALTNAQPARGLLDEVLKTRK